MKIFVDLTLPPESRELLERGTSGHQLLFPARAAASVLERAVPDPQLREADIAFGQPDPAAVAEAVHLKWIHVSSSGITRYDNPEFRALMARRRIAVSNSASVYRNACAVHVLSFMLAQARHLPAALKTRTASGSPAWTALRSSSATLEGEAALILGYGAIGRRLAELLHPLGMSVTAFRRHPRGDEPIPVVTEPDLPAALGRADHIVNILPDSIETKRFFDARRFAALKAGTVFYNIGRGATVDPAALLDALRSKHLKAAWLDVTDPEPLPDGDPLWQEPNCFITPHVAGGQGGEINVLVRHFLGNAKRFFRNEPLADRVM